MKKWLWRVVAPSAVIAVTIGIYWKAETCEARANKCISSFVASSKFYQAATPNEAIQACRESQSYFCRVLAPANIPNIGLFLIGVGAVWAALGTLKAIQQQTKALIESQRPRIAAEPQSSPLEDILNGKPNPRIVIGLVNRGPTTAYDVVYDAWMEVLPFPFVDFTPSAQRFHCGDKIALYPNHPPTIINPALQKEFTDAEIDGLKKFRLYICIRILVNYRDAFSPNRHSNFGFYVREEGLGYLPKYQDAN